MVGWTCDTGKDTDYVLWDWTDTGRHWLVPFLPLCCAMQDNWIEWSREYKTAQQRTADGSGNGWTSEVIFVPRSVLARAIVERFSA